MGRFPFKTTVDLDVGSGPAPIAIHVAQLTRGRYATFAQQLAAIAGRAARGDADTGFLPAAMAFSRYAISEYVTVDVGQLTIDGLPVRTGAALWEIVRQEPSLQTRLIRAIWRENQRARFDPRQWGWLNRPTADPPRDAKKQP